MHPGDFRKMKLEGELEAEDHSVLDDFMETQLEPPLRGVFSACCLRLCIPMLKRRAGVPRRCHSGGGLQIAPPEGLGAGWGWAIAPCKQVMVAKLGLAL